MLGYTSQRLYPKWTDGPGAGGAWKETPEDFEVVELPLVEPTGAGEHQWFRIEKVGRTTIDVVHALARAAGVDASEVGYAGMKDRFARTTQDFTVHFGKDVERLPDGMTIVAKGRTARRLRVGQLRGNEFRIRVRGGDADVAEARLARLRETGMPNYYGVQRVGGDAPAQGRAVLLGGGPRLRFDQLKFTLSAFQSLLFNRVLQRRGRARLDGDLEEDGVPTGPIYGHAMRWPTGEALALEEAVLAEEALPAGAWSRFPKLTQGTRRKLWVPADATVDREPDAFRLCFRLPAGSYATVLLEEIL
ncbi:MAG: tRNA pseudouridine(13) synthase TruD [Myxococcota bacterium]